MITVPALTIPVSETLTHDIRHLIEAVRGGDVPRIRQILEQGCDVNGEVWQTTALVEAILTGSESLVNTLIDLGADVNCGCHHAVSPLCVAAAMDRVPIAQLLLNRGANIDLLADSRPLYTVITPLHYAIVKRNVPMAKLLLDNGHDPNCPSNFHRHPVLEAIRQDCPGIMRLLAANPRCNVNTMIDGFGGWEFPPLHQALFIYHRYQVAQILLDSHRCQLSFQGDSYLCVLLWRVLDPSLLAAKIARMLLEAGADLSCSDRMGHSTLTSFLTGNRNLVLTRSINVLRIVLCAGLTPTPAEARQLTVHAKTPQDLAFCQWMTTVARNPPSLKFQIRKFLRRSFGVYPGKKIQRLPLPTALLEFVSLRCLRSL